MAKISMFFTGREVTYSATAEKFKLDNTPTNSHWKNVLETAAKLDQVRELLGVPFNVNSWYRGEQLNTKVGGSKTSDHCKGFAVDITTKTIPSYELAHSLVRACETLGLSWDQIIFEQTWVHISFAPRSRCQKLTYKAGSYTVGFSQ